MKKVATFGIIGVGYVGGAVQNWIEKQGKHQLFVYDKFKKLGSVTEVNKADVIFICVPTPYTAGRGFDDRAVVDALKNVQGSKVVVIKSTIVPGSTERFQKMFPKLTILFNPEFLVAKTAVRDFAEPNRQIVGYTARSKKVATEILKLLPRAPFERTLPATEAELIKYFGNTFLATRVIFANQIYDLCQKLGANYDLVKEGAGADPRIGTSHFTVMADGYRGYDGACLPKDVKSLVWLANTLKVNADLLTTVDRINENLWSKQKKPVKK